MTTSNLHEVDSFLEYFQLEKVEKHSIWHAALKCNEWCPLNTNGIESGNRVIAKTFHLVSVIELKDWKKAYEYLKVNNSVLGSSLINVYFKSW